jgi:integrase
MRGSVVKRTSGLYAIRYYGPDKRRRYETVGPNHEDAKRALTARLREIDTGTWREPSAETLSDYAERWLGRVTGRVAPSTHREYRRSLDLYVLPCLGARTLASLRAEHVDDLIGELEAEGRAAGTIRNALTPLRRMLNDAVRLGLIPSNPATRANLPPAQGFIGKELPLADTEAIRAALVKLAPPDPLHRDGADLFYVSMFDVALGTGLRLGELRALRWGDIDKARRLIRVERAYSRSELRKPKTKAGIRSVPLFPSVAAAFDALAARAVERGRYAPDELVFASESGRPLWPSNFDRRVWAKALQRAGLGEWQENEKGRRWTNRYRFHDLRHTCVSRLVADGADVKLVQAVAGHAKTGITLDRYSHLTDERVTEAAERFDPAVPKGARTGSDEDD